MEYRCIGTKTYYVDKIYDSDDDNYKYVILIDGNNQVNNVKVKNVIINNIEVGNSYEFVYRSNDGENSIDEIINDKIVNIIKSNKSREDYVEINSCK